MEFKAISCENGKTGYAIYRIVYKKLKNSMSN